MQPKDNNQIGFLDRDRRTGTLTVYDPYIDHKNRTNDIKRQHYEAIQQNPRTMRRQDYIFCVLYKYTSLTDSEIQIKIKEIYNVWIKDHLIPARRADIIKCKKGWCKNWEVKKDCHRECSITKTVKCSWKLVYTG